MYVRTMMSLAIAVCLLNVSIGVRTVQAAPAANPSPDGTQVPPSSSIVDNALATWTIGSGGRILRNGAQANGGYGSIIWWTSGSIKVYGTDQRWYTWTGSAWSAAAATPSPSGTRVPPAPSIVDNALSSWTIASDGRILRNGSQVSGGYGSIIDWTNNVISVLGTDARWYTWTGSQWKVQAAVAQPSPDLTEIPPSSSIVDATLATWTIASDLRTLRDGVQVGGGYGSDMLWYGGAIYVFGTDQRWYTWTGSSWQYYGQSKPGGSVVGDYYVSPGQNVQSVLSSAPEGATIVLQPGIFRMQTLQPKNGQTIAGQSGAVLSGARQLTSFGRSGSAWIATGQTQETAGGGQCQSWAPQCTHPEELFIDNQRLFHVGSAAEGGPGRWYFDYGADTIYMWDDPSGHTVEASVTSYAIGGNASNVTIKSLTIEKYANVAQVGAIRGAGSGWVIDGSVVQLNHGTGIEMGPGRQVTNNGVFANGQVGISGPGTNALVSGNEIAYNNAAGYNPYWEAGGTKFTNSSNLTIRGNFVHHNDGPGLQTDINNIGVLIENNRVEDNTLSGIFHEISYQATIRYNSVSRNGTNHPDAYWVDGAGILISGSPDVEVYGNTLVDNWQGITALQGDRGSGAYGAYSLSNLYVHDNDVTQTGTSDAGSGRTGLEDMTGQLAFTSQNNRFANNHYHLGPNAQYFFWMHTNLDENGWRNYGQDLTGTFSR
jgi:hypothetical protein